MATYVISDIHGQYDMILSKQIHYMFWVTFWTEVHILLKS